MKLTRSWKLDGAWKEIAETHDYVFPLSWIILQREKHALARFSSIVHAFTRNCVAFRKLQSHRNLLPVRRTRHRVPNNKSQAGNSTSTGHDNTFYYWNKDENRTDWQESSIQRQ